MRRTAIKKVSKKTAERNKTWHQIVLDRAFYLDSRYGRIVCEYSGETIWVLSTRGDNLNDGWGHHIDGNRNNCTPENCLIIKYKYHQLVHDNNIKVTQEGFAGRVNRLKEMDNAEVKNRVD